MNTLQHIERWGDAHHPKWLDFVRMILGLFLFLKGIEFINNMEALSDMMARSGFLGSISLGILAHYVVFAHLLGGAMIAVGLLTRLAALVQIPILLGAIIFINGSGGIMAPHHELWLSILVLVLLIAFLIGGSGPLSMDDQMKKQPPRK